MCTLHYSEALLGVLRTTGNDALDKPVVKKNQEKKKKRYTICCVLCS